MDIVFRVAHKEKPKPMLNSKAVTFKRQFRKAKYHGTRKSMAGDCKK